LIKKIKVFLPVSFLAQKLLNLTYAIPVIFFDWKEDEE